MAWIEFHATRIKRLKKFSDFRKELRWSIHESLGFLGDWWGQTVEVCETGEVTGWSPAYLSELTGLGPQVSPRVWEALVKHGWINRTSDGRLLIHDWPDWAGRFLRGRYSGNVEKLREIWSLHGRDYGREPVTDKLPTSSRQVTDKKPTLPNLTLPNHTLPTTKDIGVRRAHTTGPPGIEEVRAYCLERGGKVDADRWFDYYQSNGWKVGRNAMKDWKASLRTWEKNLSQGGQNAANKMLNPGEARPKPGKYADRKDLEINTD